MFFCWDSFPNDLEGDSQKLVLTSCNVLPLSIVDVFPIAHTASLTEFPNSEMNRCFIRHCINWKHFLVQYKRSACKIMLYNANSLLRIKIHLADNTTQLSYEN